MNRRLTKEQRIFTLQEWWTSQKSHLTVSDAFQAKFPGEKVPSRQAIHQLAKKFQETGSVEDAVRSGRPVSVCTENNADLVLETFTQDPQTSQRRASNELGIARSSLRRIMKHFKLKPYRPRLLQALNEDDPDRRIEFCEWLLEESSHDPSLLDRILWTDEAIFQTNGRVNRHNCVYWSDTNPHLIIERELNVPRVAVWGGIWSNGVIGPFFFDGNVTGEKYLAMLEDVILPQLRQQPVFRKMIWQQDGAPAHYSTIVREFLDDKFSVWIGRRGTIDWPPRSPDLTPCDFSLWGIIKDGVYAQRPRNVDQLKNLIISEFRTLNNDPDLCSAICNSVMDRCKMCIERNGEQFEQFR